MAELIVRVPGSPERVFPLPEKPVVVGRGDDCDVQLLEVRASKRHLTVAPLVGSDGRRTWVAIDLHSSNGTTLGGEKVLRKALRPGDVLKVGETTLELREVAAAAPAAPAGPIVSGTLRLARVGEPATAPLPASVPAGPEVVVIVGEEEPAPGPRRPSPDERRARRRGAQALVRASAFAVVALIALVGVQIVAGGVRDDRLRRAEEKDAYEKVLVARGRSPEELESAYAAFERRFPRSRHLADLERLRDAGRGAATRTEDVEGALDDLLRTGAALSESEALGRLLELRARVEGDERLTRRVQLGLDEVARRRAESVGREWKAVDAEVGAALERNDPSAAARRLRAFRAGRPGLSEDEAGRVRAREAAVKEGAKTLADRALSAAAAESDPDRRRRLLLEALGGLPGTGEEERVVAALHGVRGGSAVAEAPPPVGTTPGLPATVPPPSVAADHLAKAAEAAGMVRERKWEAARRAYVALSETNASVRFRDEWRDRATELERVVSLVKDLADAVAAAGDKPQRAKLADLDKGGTFDVLSADVDGVRLRRGEKERTEAWSALSPPDVLALLARQKPTPDQRLAFATLAAELGERAATVEALIPLVDLPSHRDAAFLLAARRLDGRPTVPTGGYVVFDGELVDRVEHARRVEGKHFQALEAEAASIVAKLAADPLTKRLETLAARRDELDKRRARALICIFNEKHWPYPHDDPSIRTAYEAVWQEIVGRTRLVQELWDDSFSVKFGGKGSATDKLLERHAAIVAELDGKRRETGPLKAGVARFALYAGEKELGIRTFYRDAEERDRLEYNRWVMGTHNPARTVVAAAPEIEQTRITNEYRMMMGYTTTVVPGDADVRSITGENVGKILDAGFEREGARLPLYAVRIDDRLVSSARGHSLDMARRGFFAHQAPPAGDQPATSPFDRMTKAGYQGYAGSENIAQSGSPLDAHNAWLHSSGHHRNILGGWTDQGVGQAGKLWTQNFGSGGGGEPTIPGRVPRPTTEGDGGGGDTGDGN